MKRNLPPFGLVSTLILFGTAALQLYVETHFLIPFLDSTSSLEMIIWWFLVAAMGMFIPLLILGLYLLKREGFVFEIVSGKEQLILMKTVMKQMKIKDINIGTVLREISLAKNNLIDVEELAITWQKNDYLLHLRIMVVIQIEQFVLRSLGI